jgi:hypothetical protein
MEWYLDTSVDASWCFYDTAQARFRAAIFNIPNRQEQLRSKQHRVVRFGRGLGCAAAIQNFGKAISRGSFPRRARGHDAARLPVLVVRSLLSVLSLLES